VADDLGSSRLVLFFSAFCYCLLLMAGIKNNYGPNHPPDTTTTANNNKKQQTKAKSNAARNPFSLSPRESGQKWAEREGLKFHYF